MKVNTVLKSAEPQCIQVTGTVKPKIISGLIFFVTVSGLTCQILFSIFPVISHAPGGHMWLHRFLSFSFCINC